MTLLEVTVAAGMLGVLLVTSAQMLRVVSNQQRAIERRGVALQAGQAIAEQVDNIPWEHFTAAALSQIDLPIQVKQALPGGRLSITATDEVEPVAKRVLIELTWTAPNGQPVRPVRLTTWCFPNRLAPPE